MENGVRLTHCITSKFKLNTKYIPDLEIFSSVLFKAAIHKKKVSRLSFKNKSVITINCHCI